MLTVQCHLIALAGCVRASALPISGNHLTSQIASLMAMLQHYRLTKTWQTQIIFRLTFSMRPAVNGRGLGQATAKKIKKKSRPPASLFLLEKPDNLTPALLRLVQRLWRYHDLQSTLLKHWANLCSCMLWMTGFSLSFRSCRLGYHYASSQGLR